MSLPMDIRLPPEFLKKLQLESDNSPLCKPLSRMSRRASLVSTLLYTTTTGLCIYPSIRMPPHVLPRLDINKESICPSVRPSIVVNISSDVNCHFGDHICLFFVLQSICYISLEPVKAAHDVNSIFLSANDLSFNLASLLLLLLCYFYYYNKRNTLRMVQGNRNYISMNELQC